MEAPAPPDDSAATVEAAAARRRNIVRRMYDWVISWADSRYSLAALFGISFAESSVFPIPPDVLQVALSVARPKRSFLYAAVNAAGSVLGGILGWFIGYALWQSVDTFFFNHVPGFTPERFDYVGQRYGEHAFFTIFAAAFTPIPYKVFTIAAGVFHHNVPLHTLVVASLLGRSGRFFLVAAITYAFGARAKQFIERYFEALTILFAVLLIGGFVVLRFFWK
jgi:membrane protein YqaA with SNARE-associated domain